MNKLFDFIKPTYIENWPKELCSLSIAQVGIKLNLFQAEALGTNIIELYEGFPEPHFRDITDISLKINEHVDKFPKGIFVRLGSRSPKDSLYDSKIKCFTTEDIVNRLIACSERVYDDLHLALTNNYEPYIWLREWKEIPEWAEFRCFMKNRELVGISQYNYLRNIVYPEIEENKEVIEEYIRKFFIDFVRVYQFDNVVFDIFLTKRTVVNLNVWQITLLEINPFFEMTDPCLFDWRKPEDFNGEFRYNK